MTETEVFDKLLPLIREVTGARANQVTMTSNLMEDLGAESIDLLDLSFLIEETGKRFSSHQESIAAYCQGG